jgi:hypothetical protein
MPLLMPYNDHSARSITLSFLHEVCRMVWLSKSLLVATQHASWHVRHSTLDIRHYLSFSSICLIFPTRR